MLVLGVESSAHTFGVGVVDRGKVLANEKSMYGISTTGMVPRNVAQHHIQSANAVVSAALGKAGIDIRDVEGVGYTKGPGIGTCLQVGQIVAKTIASKLHVPIAPVNHAIGHIEIARSMSGLRDPLVLYVSGGNSQILKVLDHTNADRLHYSVLGETFDIGVGNMFDSFARHLGLDPAWGSSVEKVAANGRYIQMPYTVKGMDFSFTGLLTHSIKAIGSHPREDVCFSIRETAFSMLCEATERAMLMTSSKELCVCGGVAQSARLRWMLQSVASEHGARFGYAANEFNADNGAMIAFVAERMLNAAVRTALKDCTIEQRYRAERAEVFQ